MIIKDKQFNHSDDTLNKAFSSWPFELSDFQKWSIMGLLNNKNVIITAHTGSGKTLPAEFAIKHFVQEKNKKVIYCAPIKALSNEKFNDFSKKFENMEIGILTGDIKYNPEADVIIMTTEILRNNLFQKSMIKKGDTEEEQKFNENIINQLDFSLDLYNDLECVIFDEIHYINDKHRGKVWEETIMLLPQKCQILGLSATIHRPENFCDWIETVKEREVWLCPNDKRVVPLVHHSWVTFPRSILKKIPKDLQNSYEEFINKPVVLKKQGERFSDRNFYCIEKMIKYFNKNEIRANKYYVLNELINHLNYSDKLPAICFCFSRKQTLDLAQKIEQNLFREGEKTSSIIKKECEEILRKLPNYKEYLKLPEFTTLVKLLEKGIAIHHSGINTVFKEMIEKLFAKKYIKLLFATETFAVGINMPTRSVIFTSLVKYDGSNFRYIHPHEYTQMAGRAGRRNIDVEGNVYHLHNFYAQKHPDIESMKNILMGNSQVIQSKFHIHYNLLLRLIGSGKNDFKDFISKSMINRTILDHKLGYLSEKSAKELRIKNQLELLGTVATSKEQMEFYYDLESHLKMMEHKKRKKAKREMMKIEGESHSFKTDYGFYLKYREMDNDLKKIYKKIENVDGYIDNQIATHLACLIDEDFIVVSKENDEINHELTQKGLIAANIQEVHSMAFSEVYLDGILNDMTAPEIVCFLSCFTDIRLSEEWKYYNLLDVTIPVKVKKSIEKMEKALKKYSDIETYLKTDFIESYDLHYDMAEFAYNWCLMDDENSCQKLIKFAKTFDIFLGEFVKALLKINNIAHELESICELTENLSLLEKLKKIPKLTLKYVVTNESLYV